MKEFIENKIIELRKSQEDCTKYDGDWHHINYDIEKLQQLIEEYEEQAKYRYTIKGGI